MSVEETRMSFFEHLEELRRCLLRIVLAIAVGFGICFYFSETIFQFLSQPLLELLPENRREMVFTGLPDVFIMYLKIAFLSGIFVTIPYILYQFWLFVAPGLYDRERRLTLPFVITATLLFYLGGLFAYFLVFQVIFKFFLTFQTETLKPMIAIREFVSLILKLLLAFGVVFETPIIIVFLGVLGIVTADKLRKGRRYFVVFAFVIGAILSPPDVISQILMGLPLLVLYELGIQVLARIERYRARREAEEDFDPDPPDDDDSGGGSRATVPALEASGSSAVSQEESGSVRKESLLMAPWLRLQEVLLLLSPRWRRFKHYIKRPGKERLRMPFMAGMIILLWAVIFVVFVKALRYFTAEEMFGTIAAIKLLSMITATFAFVLIISNIVATFSTFFLSDELELIIPGPLPARSVYTARFLETLSESSWMVLVFGLPVFLAYGMVFSAPWQFYVLTLVGFVCLLVLTTSLGVLLVETLVKVFPVRRLRDLFVFIVILLFIGVYLLFRMIRPEDFLNPEGFATVVDYLSVMSEPSSPLLPTTWIVEIVRPYISGRDPDEVPFFLALLVTAAYGSYRLVGHFHEAYYLEGYSRANESRGARLTKSRFIAAYTRLVSMFADRPTTHLILKETLLMARDWGRISQLLLLTALVVVYLYNFTVLPSLDNPAATMFLKNTVAFINIGLAGFVMASLGVRFLFPAVSSEGRAFWILKGSPVSLRRILWIKFFFYLAPMLFLGMLLAIMTNWLLQLDTAMFVMCTITVGLLTIGITSLSIGMGVVHADLKGSDPNRTATSFGALMTMIYAGLAVAAVAILEAYPAYRLVTLEYFDRELDLKHYLIMALCFAGAFGVIAYLVVKPLRMGLNRISELEI